MVDSDGENAKTQVGDFSKMHQFVALLHVPGIQHQAALGFLDRNESIEIKGDRDSGFLRKAISYLERFNGHDVLTALEKAVGKEVYSKHCGVPK